MSRSFARTVLHLLLALSLALPAIAAPAQAAGDALQSMAAASMADTAIAIDDMPCHGEDDPSTGSEPPCDCCPQAACDLSACVGTACLVALPHVVAHVPPSAAPAPLRPVALRIRLIDTPLRPPIA